jgi:hypothetical protein
MSTALSHLNDRLAANPAAIPRVGSIARAGTRSAREQHRQSSAQDLLDQLNRVRAESRRRICGDWANIDAEVILPRQVPSSPGFVE